MTIRYFTWGVACYSIKSWYQLPMRFTNVFNTTQGLILTRVDVKETFLNIFADFENVWWGWREGGGGGFYPSCCWFFLNNSETLKAATLVFCSIQYHFVRQVRAKLGIHNSTQFPDIGQNFSNLILPLPRPLLRNIPQKPSPD